MKSICVAILNHNGVHHLEQLLPSLRDGIGHFEGPYSLVVLDNRSFKGDREWLANNHPEIEVVLAPTNAFLYSYNWLAEKRPEDVLILLNNHILI